MRWRTMHHVITEGWSEGVLIRELSSIYNFFFSSRRRHTRCGRDWSSDVCSSDLVVYHSWKNNHNKARGAVVTYPINYDPTLKYPAIFEIYEQRKSTQHTYVTTTITNGNGINSRVYSNEGYFVIRPDIYYEIGEPGPSASQCVNETLDYLMNILPLDADNLGLIGHSFGGYQTNYIITQTNRFKAAVSSAGVADIVNAYFTFSQEYKIPDMFRYETQQFRMGKNFFEAKNNYMQNSPLFYADRI